MSRILLVEDELAMHAVLCSALSDYQVDAVESVAEALHYLKGHNVDLLLLDLMLGAENGIKVAEYVRIHSPYTAIVILTGHASLESTLRAIELGVHAYLLKPVRPDELVRVVSEQIHAMQEIRRRDELARHMQAAVSILIGRNSQRTSGALTLDHSRYEATYGRNELSLSTTQFRILWILVENEGKTVSAQQVAAEALGYAVSEVEASSLVRGHISKIRQQIALHAGGKEHILTLRNQGYSWVS